MRHVILGFLLMGQATLYELHKQFLGGVSQFYSASLGGLRTALARLVDDGHAVVEERVENGRLKRIHSITESGQGEFFTWMMSPIEGSNLEVALLSKVYFLGLLEPEQRTAVVGDMLHKVRAERESLKEIEKSLEELEVPQEWADIAHFQIKTLDYGISAHNAAIAWIEALLADLPSPDAKHSG